METERYYELVVAVGKLSMQLDSMHTDLKEIKHDLYEAGNGGMIGWMYGRKGYRTAFNVVLPIGVAAVTAFAVLLIGKLMG